MVCESDPKCFRRLYLFAVTKSVFCTFPAALDWKSCCFFVGSFVTQISILDLTPAVSFVND